MGKMITYLDRISKDAEIFRKTVREPYYQKFLNDTCRKFREKYNHGKYEAKEFMIRQVIYIHYKMKKELRGLTKLMEAENE